MSLCNNLFLLEHLGKALNAERTYIFEKNAQGCDDNTYEWTAPGIIPQKEYLQNLPPEVCANWYQLFSEGEFVLISDPEEIRESDPLKYTSSYKDPMTGLGNRFALSVFVDEIDKEASLGVIYADITSLKCVNDCKGHLAGDRLILRACGCLIEMFDGYDIFRMGGDELLVLCSGIAADDLEERIAKRHTLMKERSVNMAIGNRTAQTAKLTCNSNRSIDPFQGTV